MLTKWINYSLLCLLLMSACRTASQINQSGLSMTEVDGLLQIWQGDQMIVGYQFGKKAAPSGVDPVYERSGFIHPVNTLAGHRLTQIQPADHYHHYGIWNPWTKVKLGQDTIDFWNLNGKQGTVRFAEFIDKAVDENTASYTALHEHVLLKGNQNKVILNEYQTVQVHSVKEDHYLIDMDIRYECATDIPFHIVAHRYQGLGWRATEEWDAHNSRIITSSGMSRKNADNTTARWIIYQGELGSGRGGMIMLSHPDNYNHPEPIRVWPPETHDGAVFVNFSPAKTKDWLLQTDQNYKLRYRFIVFDGEMSAVDAESHWLSYTK